MKSSKKTRLGRYPFVSRIMKYTLIAVPALGQAQNTLQNVKSKLASLAEVHAFHVPEFKVQSIHLGANIEGKKLTFDLT